MNSPDRDAVRKKFHAFVSPFFDDVRANSKDIEIQPRKKKFTETWSSSRTPCIRRPNLPPGTPANRTVTYMMPFQLVKCTLYYFRYNWWNFTCSKPPIGVTWRVHSKSPLASSERFQWCRLRGQVNRRISIRIIAYFRFHFSPCNVLTGPRRKWKGRVRGVSSSVFRCSK